MAEQSTLSRNLWDSKYGWGPHGTLARARDDYFSGTGATSAFDAFATYASRLYSVMGDPKAGHAMRAVAHVRLLVLVYYGADIVREADYDVASPEQCETLAAILLKLSNMFWLAAWHDTLRSLALVCVSNGIDSEMPAKLHTQAFLCVHCANLGGTRRTRMAHLQRAEVLAARIDGEPDQQSRVYRGIALAWAALGDPDLATRAMSFAETTPGVSASTIAKNAKARAYLAKTL